MNELNHPGGWWTARWAAVFLVLLVLMTGVSASGGREPIFYLPPAPLGPRHPQGPIPPADPPVSGDAQSAPQSAVVRCASGFCANLPLVINTNQQPSPGNAPVDREGSLSFYRQTYLASGNVAPSWTGNVSGCNAGQTSSAFRSAVLARLNYFRRMAGVPALEGLDDGYNGLDQQAALMMSANNQLSHSPDSSWKCYTQAGKDGAGSSNLYLGGYGPAAITGYMRDPGAGNAAAGHRRWILYPQNRKMGTGDIPTSGGYAYANALRAWDGNFGGPRPATRDAFVAWPPAGYVPYPVVFARWSFAYPDANFDSATVTMTLRGANIPVTRFTPAYGFGENTLVWQVNSLADGADWPRPSADDPYVVTIRNAIVGGVAKNFTYTVTVINPD